MMINEKALINNIRSAFKAGSLTIEARQDKGEEEEAPIIWIIGGSKWEYTTEDQNITRKVKAALMETTGILPEVGIKYTCSKDAGNQITMRDSTRSTWEDMTEEKTEITGMVYESTRLGALRFVKCFMIEENKIISIYERIAHMILTIDMDDDEKPVYTSYRAGHITVTNGEEQIIIYETDCIADPDVVEVMKAVNTVL